MYVRLVNQNKTRQKRIARRFFLSRTHTNKKQNHSHIKQTNAPHRSNKLTWRPSDKETLRKRPVAQALEKNDEEMPFAKRWFPQK